MDGSNKPISPCQGICKFNDEDKCIGCFRRREDIDNWFYLSDGDKQTIIDQVLPLITMQHQKGR